MKYASMLTEKMQQHGTHAWLVNTGGEWHPWLPTCVSSFAAGEVYMWVACSVQWCGDEQWCT
jgi:hypothetical protein